MTKRPNRTTNPARILAADAGDPALEALQVRDTLGQLEDLRRMRGIGMNLARRLQARFATAEFDPNGGTPEELALEFADVCDALCEIVALERELAGLRPAPSAPQAASGDKPQPTPAERPRRRLH